MLATLGSTCFSAPAWFEHVACQMFYVCMYVTVTDVHIYHPERDVNGAILLRMDVQLFGELAHFMMFTTLHTFTDSIIM